MKFLKIKDSKQNELYLNMDKINFISDEQGITTIHCEDRAEFQTLEELQSVIYRINNNKEMEIPSSI